ncbi:hypothetical protein CVD28_00180 [Bacillus sp. M6-12]|uniref:hypothetical protein n=1 Tax=Bacillus sp. M6-12 TaxID=2054166 RepID=UPI000C75BF54|nr:hypothetical protein [Bacillus sp. M6-12]PLS18853.1 hypothetical protein CVD28_00180 [Bacillus sp. M6-12]
MTKKTKLIVSISVFAIILVSVIGYLGFKGASYADESSKKPSKIEQQKKETAPTSKKEEVEKQEIKEGFKKEVNGSTFTILKKSGEGNQVVVDILVDNATKNEQFIAIAKEVNTLVSEEGKKNVTVKVFQSEKGASVAEFTFDNLSGKKQAELNRTHSFGKVEIQYGRVDYDVSNATVNGATADISVIASNSDSRAMFDIAKELSELTKEENKNITTINISFFNSSEAYNNKTPQWVYTDNASTQISEKSTFGY